MARLLSLPGLASAVALACVVGCSPAAPPPTSAPAAPAETAMPTPDLKAVARTMVAAGLVKAGDKVIISGSVRDNQLLEDLAVETMKVGGEPLITVSSQELGRRSYDEVPATFDSQPPALMLGLTNLQDVSFTVDVGENDAAMAGVPADRVTARAKAGVGINAAFLRRGIRMVNLGNGLYPTKALASRLGVSQGDLATLFWKAVTVAPESIRATGGAMRTTLSGAKTITLTSANGTNVTFGVNADRGFLSDGAVTPDKVKQGSAATQTWLPAGELLVPVVLGSAEGQIVIDKLLYQGTLVEGLTLTFSKGRLTAMTARSGLDGLKARYDAAGAGKDQFSYIDIGLNPEAKLPTTTGRIVWVAPGAVTIGLGDNTGWGGTNVSDYNLSGTVGAATLTADGKVLIENGTLK